MWGGEILAFAPQIVVNPAAHDEQANELTGVERVRRARAGPPSEAVCLVMIGGAVAV